MARRVPEEDPGMRLAIANFFCHMATLPQDHIPNPFPRELADDCADPKLFKRLAGFGSPYRSQVYPLPRTVVDPIVAG